MIHCVQAKAIDLLEAAQQGSLTREQMGLVKCFAPERVDETDRVGWYR